MASTNFSNHITDLSVTDTRFVTSKYLFGACAAWMFSGFMIVQAFTYFRHSKKDPKFMKSIVYVTIFLQLLETGTESFEAYAIDSLGWGDPDMYDRSFAIIVDNMQGIIVPLTAFIVQSFFIWRIWMFSKAFILHAKLIRTFLRFVCAGIALVSLLSLAAALALNIQAQTSADVPRWYNMMLVIWLASSAVVDITITICMMSLLLHAKTRSHFGETRDLLSRLIRIVLPTGLLASFFALLVLLLYFLKLEFFFELPWFFLGKSEAISLLANLNARKRPNALGVYASDNGQAVPPATGISTMDFSPPNRCAGAGKFYDCPDASRDVHFSPQTSQSATTADFSEKFGQDETKSSDVNQFNVV